MKDYSAGSLSIFYMACLCDLLYFNISYVVAAWFSDDTLSQSTEFFYYVTFGLCHKPSVCRLTVMLLHPRQRLELFGSNLHRLRQIVLKFWTKI